MLVAAQPVEAVDEQAIAVAQKVQQFLECSAWVDLAISLMQLGVCSLLQCISQNERIMVGQGSSDVADTAQLFRHGIGLSLVSIDRQASVMRQCAGRPVPV